jgi:hypothetical protein
MEKKTMVLSVNFTNLFNDKEDRMKLGFKFKEKFDARKVDKTTGEYIITKDNELSFTKKQFVFKLQDNFVINLMATNLKFEELLPIEVTTIFKDVKLTIDRTRLEEGDTYLDIDGNEQTADGEMFLTELKDIEFTDKNINAIKAAILGQAPEKDKDKVAAMLEIVL